LVDRSLELAAVDDDLSRKYEFLGITIDKQYQQGLPKVLYVEAEIQQVILNILRNTAQALEDRPETANPPQIKISISQLDDPLRVEIEENGPGMDKQTSKRMFEPFYTTDPSGGGTGLGLSVSFFMITEPHHGNLVVESNPAVGSNFFITLPLSG